jgi:hypothetical protein
MNHHPGDPAKRGKMLRIDVLARYARKRPELIREKQENKMACVRGSQVEARQLSKNG